MLEYSQDIKGGIHLRRLISWMLALVCMLSLLPAQAEQISMSGLPGILSLPDGVYAPVLTADTLKDNESFILNRGGTVASWQEEFKQQGIMLKAYDEKNNRVLVVSSLGDADGQRYGDIDMQSANVRAEYRALHQKDGPFAAQGYRVESAEWKNFDGIGRFLMIRYSFRVDGEVHHRGFARRSVKNGRTVMIDMQVYDRQLKSGDNTALNKVFDTLVFTGDVGDGVSMPVFLNETATAPKETYESTFTMKGITRAGAKLNAVVLAFTSNKPVNFTTVADDKGNYTLPITLPETGIYMMTLAVQAEGLDTLEKSYSITYDRGLLPVEFTAELPEELTQDQYKIMGKTEPGVTVQMVIGEKTTTKKTNNNRNFSFTVNTKEEGSYQVRLTFSKKGFNSRSFEWLAARGTALPAAPTVEQAVEAAAQQATGEALSPPYTDLIAKAETYDGKLLTYDGYVAKTEQIAGEYVISLALRKAVTGYADTVMLVTDTDPSLAVDSHVRVWGVLVGLNVTETEETGPSYPKLQLQRVEALAQDTQPAGE